MRILVPVLLRSLLVSLLLTEALEALAALALGFRARRDFLLLLLVNLVTNPVVGVLFDGFFLFAGVLPPWYVVLAAEAAAVGAEALLYRGRLRYRKLHPLLLSLILNVISFVGGLLYEKLF